jgi:hypothetical protein
LLGPVVADGGGGPSSARAADDRLARRRRAGTPAALPSGPLGLEPGASSSSAITLTATQPCVFAEQEGGSQRYSEGQRQEQGEGSAEANADKDDCGDQEGQRVR